MATKVTPVRLPGNPWDPTEPEIATPLTDLLHDLSLLGTPQELSDASSAASVLFGPPQSVAIIEAAQPPSPRSGRRFLGRG